MLAFLADLQTARGNRPRSSNARLTAIKSFMHFVEHRVPAALVQVHRVLAIPAQKTDLRLVDHLTVAQYQPLLDAPDPTTRSGIRDRTMLYLAITAGLRVSELVGLRLNDVTFTGRYVDLHVRGKGRKEHAHALEGGRRRRAGVAGRAGRGARSRALSQCPRPGDDARRLRVPSPQACRHRPRPVSRAAEQADLAARARHTCALNVLQATGDIRQVALWLGHESIQTTEDYLRVDVTSGSGSWRR